MPTSHPCTVGGRPTLPRRVVVCPAGPRSARLVVHPAHRSQYDQAAALATDHDIRPGERQLKVHCDLTSTGFVRFPYLWGVHPAVPIGAAPIQVPAREAWYAEGDVPSDEPALVPGQTVAAPWPVASLERPNRVPGGTWVLLTSPTCRTAGSVCRTNRRSWGLGVPFRTDQFTDIHLWLVDGGWRGLRCVAVEPWTGRPPASARPSTPNVPVAVTVAKPARGDHRLSAVGRAAVVIARVDVATAAPTGTIPGASCSVTRRGPVTNFLPDRVGLGPVSISHVSASARSSLVENLQ